MDSCLAGSLATISAGAGRASDNEFSAPASGCEASVDFAAATEPVFSASQLLMLKDLP
jgi:hypothetical protein